MKRYVKEHEKYIQEQIDDNRLTTKLIQYHKDRIIWLEHERMAHLLVFILVMGALTVFFSAALFMGILWLFVIVGLLVVLAAFYAIHYYFLENTVQKWYEMADAMERAC